ncbi:MAG: hypothetical protein ACI8V4_003753 [Ilumatobacter sp.]|jgi:hypothetical protein
MHECPTSEISLAHSDRRVGEIETLWTATMVLAHCPYIGIVGLHTPSFLNCCHQIDRGGSCIDGVRGG